MSPAAGAAAAGEDVGVGTKGVQIVKVEDGAAPKAADGDDEADYGDDDAKGEAKVKPEFKRPLPDYGDLIDADDDCIAVKVKEDDEKKGPVGDKRPDSILISGTQRLTRSHLEEVFEAKKLPSTFTRIEQISNTESIIVFSSKEDAAAVLASVDDGFGDTMSEDSLPGPGLWRAQRGMLDFRYATTEDSPNMGWKVQHRGGRQVREFRFWEAIKELDKGILAAEDARGEKRPSLITDTREEEDVFAPPAKKRRTEAVDDGEDEEEDEPDLLEQMAKQDRGILEPSDVAEGGESHAWPAMAWGGEWGKAHGRGQESTKGDRRDRRDSGTWSQHDTRGDDGGEWGKAKKGGKAGKGGGYGPAWSSWYGDGSGDAWAKGGGKRGRSRSPRRKGGGGGKDNGDKRGERSQGGGQESAKAPVLEGGSINMDDEEKSRREKRADRFKGIRSEMQGAATS